MQKAVLLRFLAVGFVFSAIACKPEEEILKEQAAKEVAQPQQQPIPDQVAKVGVGVKGDSLDSIQGNDPRKIIAGPAQAYFRTKEKLVFEVQLPHTLNAFKALNGRDPKSHEEYMEVIAGIKLPKLPEGMIYRYHPDDGELWVEAEKKEGQ